MNDNLKEVYGGTKVIPLYVRTTSQPLKKVLEGYISARDTSDMGRLSSVAVGILNMADYYVSRALKIPRH